MCRYTVRVRWQLKAAYTLWRRAYFDVFFAKDVETTCPVSNVVCCNRELFL